MPVQYTGAVGIVCRCIADIGTTKREEEADDYELNFDELGQWGSGVMCMYMYMYMCAVLLCLVVCLILLASLFLPSLTSH